MPTFTVKSDKVSYTSPATWNDVVANFQFDFGNNNKNLTIVGGDVVEAQNGDIYVKKLTVTLPTVYGYGAGATLDVTVNKLLTKK